MARRCCVGYTLVDVLVTLGIVTLILFVASMSQPGGKEVSRQTFCLNNQSQLAKAHLGFHVHKNRFCGYVNSVGSDFKRTSWVVPIFPYIDRADLWERWSETPLDPTNPTVSHPHTYIESLICPSNPPWDEKTSPMSYVVNGGFADDLPRQENEANGIFHNQYPSVTGPFNPREAMIVTLQYLASNDGASKTMLISENLQWVTTWRTFDESRATVAMIWHDSAAAASPRRINVEKKEDPAGNLDYARPSSFHSQGVNMVFADGHGKFVAESIAYVVYQQLLTPVSKKSSLPDLPLLDESAF